MHDQNSSIKVADVDCRRNFEGDTLGGCILYLFHFESLQKKITQWSYLQIVEHVKDTATSQLSIYVLNNRTTRVSTERFFVEIEIIVMWCERVNVNTFYITSVSLFC